MRTSRRVFTLLIGWAISCTLQAQKNIGDYFVDMPLNLIPTLESSYRLELVENYRTSGKDTVQNMFGTSVKLLSLDTINQHINVKTTANSRFEMLLFRQNNDTVIGIIYTVCAPVCSSYIHFYDSQWKKKAYSFPAYDITHWLKAANSPEENKLVKDLVKADFIELSFNPKEQAVEVRNNSLEYLSEEENKMIENRVEEKVIYFSLR